MTMIGLACFFVCCLLPLAACNPLVCPNMEDVFPCTCKRVAYGLHVMCANFNSTSKLNTVFQILRDYNVHKILLHGVYLTDPVPANFFDGMHVKELKVERSRLKFSQPAFTGLGTSLNVLEVADCSLVKTDNGFDLAPLTKLSELDIQSNRIRKVSDDWLKGRVPNVQKLVLDHNDIDSVGENAFADMTQLRQISLADNRITAVSRSMFARPALSLLRIDLSHNELQSVPSDIFRDMPSLQEVVLSGNEIQTLPEQTWIDIWGRLNQVLLYENSLVCDEKLQWIKNMKPPSRLEGTCMAPTTMKGKSIKDIFDT